MKLLKNMNRCFVTSKKIRLFTRRAFVGINANERFSTFHNRMLVLAI